MPRKTMDSSARCWRMENPIELMYQTYDLDSVQPSGDEPLGTKKKFWFVHDEFGRCLFKLGKPQTGELGGEGGR